MAKDPRYNLVNELIKQKRITDFSDIFLHIPISVVAKDMKKATDVVRKNVYQPGRWKVVEIVKLSELFKVNYETMFALIVNGVEGTK